MGHISSYVFTYLNVLFVGLASIKIGLSDYKQQKELKVQ